MLMIYISYDRPVIGHCCLLSGYCIVLCENTPCAALYNVLTCDFPTYSTFSGRLFFFINAGFALKCVN